MMKILIILLVALWVSPASASYNVWLDNTLTKYRQGGEDGTSGSTSLTISMAKNEFESFQVMLYANGESLSNVDVTVSNLTKGSDTIDDIYIYKQHYITTTTKSRVDYALGSFPDALLPKVDRYYHETRNTFPFAVASGKVQGVWVDIGTTTTTPAGTYTGTVTVSAQGKADVTRAITVVVKNFTIPSTKQFRAIAGVEDGSLSYGHMGTLYDRSTMMALYPLYAKAALYHGLSTWAFGGGLTSGTYTWNNGTATMSNFSTIAFPTYYGPILTGSAITSGPYAGATGIATTSGIGGAHNMGVSSIIESDATISDANKATAAAQYNQLFYNYVGSNGWSPDTKLMIGVFDEPSAAVNVTWKREADDEATEAEVAMDQANDAVGINTSIHGDGTQFKNIFVNGINTSDLTGFPGSFDPWIGHFAPAGWEKTNASSTYIKPYSGYPASTHHWAYMSCMSNGCAGTGDADSTGQIDLSLDAPAVYNRTPALVYYLHHRDGFLYWSLNTDMYSGAADPYSSVWYYGSNGDGHLLYQGVAGEFGTPGGANTPNIGGTHDIPIESIRLKHVRDFIEDMEKLRIAESNSSRASVITLVNSNFTQTSNIDLMYWNQTFDAAQYISTMDSVMTLAAGGGVSTANKWKIKAITDDN
jgi:hypothetical protein